MFNEKKGMEKLKSIPSQEKSSSYEYASTQIDNASIPDKKSKDDIEEFIKNNIYDDLTDKNKNIIDELIKLKESEYIDQRKVFRQERVVNTEFAKQSINELINNGNKNFARIYIDVEGLKTINDIVGHEKGDIYLKEIYKAINKTVEDIKKDYPELKDELECIISAEGGDEFGVLLKAKEGGGIDLAKDKFLLSAKGKPESEERISVIFGRLFNDNLSEIDYNSFITREDIEKQFPEIIEKYKDYQFMASASFGAVEYEGDDWCDEMELEKRKKELMQKQSIDEETAEKQIKYDMFLTKAGQRMQEDKDRFKEELRLSGKVDSPEWQNLYFHSLVLARSEEHTQLLEEHQKLIGENEALKEENEKLKAELKTKGD